MSRLSDQIFSNQAQVWLHNQLEPDQVITRGNAKQYREISRMGAKNKAIEDMRERLGQEEMTRREIEFLESKKIKEDL